MDSSSESPKAPERNGSGRHSSRAKDQNRISLAMKDDPASLGRDSAPSLSGATLDISRPSIAVDPVALITTECITVTSSMRKHARWAHSSVAAILGGSSTIRGNAASSKGPGQSRHKPSASVALLGENLSDSNMDSAASRWGLRGKQGKSLQDNPLMSAFARLRRDLRECSDIRTFDVPSLLHPFLQVIRSSSTSASITSLALVAITKFFAYGFLTKESPRLSLGMQLLSAAITHCRFEASESAADEIVLLRILKLMEVMLSGPGGDLLGDESVCEMMETGLSMCCQSRLSELLRSSAEISMIGMCQTVFERLKHLEEEAGGDIQAMTEEGNDASLADLKMDAPLHGTNAASIQANEASKSSDEAPAEDSKPSEAEAEAAPVEAPPAEAEEKAQAEKTQDGDQSTKEEAKAELPGKDESDAPKKSEEIQKEASQAVNGSEDAPIKPYSLPSIRELFRVLVDLLDPHDHQHTETMRIMALRIIDIALEVAGPSIAKHPSLASLAKDKLCRHLFQLVRSDSMNLLNESLRVAGTLLATCRSVLKLQQELFLSYLVACLHPKVPIPQEPGINPRLYEGVPVAPKLAKPSPSPSTPSSGRSTPVPVKDRQKLGMEGSSRKPDAREAMVESIGALVRIPGFLAELFINYDCEVDRGDLCEDLIGLLARSAFPDSATWSTTNVPPLCLDALLTHIQFLADRLNEKPSGDYPDTERLRKQRAMKKIIVKGTTKFNEKPQAGIAYLASQGIIKNPDDPVSVAKFLKGTTRVSKKVLGEFLSKKGHENLLGAYMDLFDFTNKRVDEALRDLLGAFRLPGESPLIERIVTVFSDKYCANTTPEGIADKDAVYVLTYAIIMLNTDQHNPNVKKQNRMTFEAFAKNLRGVNGGKDFDKAYLEAIFDEIKNNEIILPDEHDNKHAFEYAWKELLGKADSSGDLVLCHTNVFDADMFEATWKPIIATLSYVFMSASEDAVYQRVIAGFHQCAQVAAKYGLTETLDHIVYCLSTISTLAPEEPTSTTLNTEVQVGQKSIMVSELAVKFGRDYRAQLATVVLFKGVVASNEGALRSGWKHVVRTWLNLFSNSLMASPLPSAKNFLDISPIPVQSPTHVVNRENRDSGAGLFQSFTSYLSSYAADDPPEPSDEEINDTLCTVDCINACPMADIFQNMINLPAEPIASLVHSLLELLPQDASPVVAVVKPEVSSAAPARLQRKPASRLPHYDPSIIYVLELAAILAINNKNCPPESGKEVAEALQGEIRSPSTHPIIISRSAFYLLTLITVNHVSCPESPLVDLLSQPANMQQEHSSIRAPVILHTLSSLDHSVLEKAALPILKGLSVCVGKPGPLRNEILNTPDFWSAIRSIHTVKDAAEPVFNLLMSIVEQAPFTITADNYEASISLLNDFATAGSAAVVAQRKPDRNDRRPRQPQPLVTNDKALVERGVKAVTCIFKLSEIVPNLISQSQLERKEAWTAYWLPIFRALGTQCINPCREIRQRAFGGLQRALLSPQLASPNHQEWTAIFGQVLFPLIHQLLRPEVYHSDPAGMSETRVHAATLLCKIFLHYLVLLSDWEGMLDLWLKILDIMDRLINSGQGDSLEEAVPESIKNILLVMANSGYLVPPSENPEKAKLWDETRKRLERFLPGMFEELFLSRQEPAKKSMEQKDEKEAKEEGEKKG